MLFSFLLSFIESLCIPSEGITTIHPFVRLDFQSFDPALLLSLLSTLQCGGSRAICTNPGRLMEHITLVRPTHFGASPSFWNSLYRQYWGLVQNQLVQASEESFGGKEGLSPLNAAEARKKAESNAGVAMKKMLGGRLHVATCGGASLADVVSQFCKSKLGLQMVSLYGCREVGGIARDGVIYSGVLVRLRDVPELGYSTTSCPPRGEICVHSPRAIENYFSDDVLSSSSFIKMDGKMWYCTGDIGELTGEVVYGKREEVHAGGVKQREKIKKEKDSVLSKKQEGNSSRSTKEALYGDPLGPSVLAGPQSILRVIDRKSSFFKLSNGEWVSPDRVELLLEANSLLLNRIYVTGSAETSYCVGVVLPSASLRSLHQKQCLGTLSVVSDTNQCKCVSLLMRDVRRISRLHRLRPHQIPQLLYIDFEISTWDEKNGLLTSTSKKQRSSIGRYYKHVIETLLKTSFRNESGESGEGEERVTIEAADETRSDVASDLSSSSMRNQEKEVSDRASIEYPCHCVVHDLLESSFPKATRTARRRNMTLLQLGADSVTAARLALQLESSTMGLIHLRAVEILDMTVDDILSLYTAHHSAPSVGEKENLAFDSATASASASAASSKALTNSERVFESTLTSLPPSTVADIDWGQEWSLPHSFYTASSASTSTSPSASVSRKPCASSSANQRPLIVLVGSSGFLGPILLSEILQQKDLDNFDILCLLRGKSDTDAAARLTTLLEEAREEVPSITGVEEGGSETAMVLRRVQVHDRHRQDIYTLYTRQKYVLLQSSIE